VGEGYDKDRVAPNGDSLSCAEGSTCPPVGTTRSLKPWVPLRSTQEPVLRCAPVCKSLFSPYM
jgi:hypothetical protein